MNGVAMEFVSNTEDPDLAEIVATRLEKSGPDAIINNQPASVVLPGLIFDGIIGTLFINAFFSKNGGGGFELFSNGVGFGELVQLIPLGFGIYYAASAIQKSAGIISSKSKGNSSEV